MKIKLYIMYLILYWLIGIVCFVLVFGIDNSIKILFESPYKGLFSGILIFLSSLIASAILFYLKKETLSKRLYHYLVLGFYIGNFSLLILLIGDAFFRNLIVWKFPEFLLAFLAPLIELLFSYLFGFAFLAIIPSVLSAFLLYWINNNFINRKKNKELLTGK